jgi:hypothetical protein
MPHANPIALLAQKTGNWWADERRNWCAYCGDSLQGRVEGAVKATRDHVLPRAHTGRHVTIPACRACNLAKSSKSLSEFLLTKDFAKAQSHCRPHRWSIRDLWLVLALAAVEQARSNSQAWPS